MGRKKDKTGETVNSETGSVGSSSIVRVSLNDQVLQDALKIYLDETKPDPLIREQLSEPTSSWSWVKESSDTAVPAVAELLEDATHYLAGTATWSGAYASVDLRVRTCWKASTVTTTKSVDGDDTGESHKQDDCNGSLVTVCHASAHLGASTMPSDSSEGKKPKKDKVQEKITSRMIERLKDDAYIAKWLLAKEPSLLYEANIMLSNEDNQLEERVDTAPDVAEAVRRAVFFAAEDSLDVLEVVLALPFLPAVKHATVLLSKNKKKTATTALADRARLRLLEDAMCDACEQQGEEDMVQDLDIQSAKKSKVDE
jgi:hypothetical protein